MPLDREMSETEKRVYLIFSLIFDKIMDEQGYQMGTYTWNKVRPNLMDQIGLNDDIWVDLSDSGDESEDLQTRLAEMSEKFEELKFEELLADFSSIFTAIN